MTKPSRRWQPMSATAGAIKRPRSTRRMSPSKGKGWRLLALRVDLDGDAVVGQPPDFVHVAVVEGNAARSPILEQIGLALMVQDIRLAVDQDVGARVDIERRGARDVRRLRVGKGEGKMI